MPDATGPAPQPAPGPAPDPSPGPAPDPSPGPAPDPASQGLPPRAESLARIAAAAALLRSRHARPPDPFAWTEHEESSWWAFGDLGRRTVRTPVRFGWAVGDYPWEGVVRHGPETFGNEVFVKPTFVDAEGRILPENPGRALPADNHLLTDAMCRDIAARMEEIAAAAVASPGER